MWHFSPRKNNVRKTTWIMFLYKNMSDCFIVLKTNYDASRCYQCVLEFFFATFSVCLLHIYAQLIVFFFIFKEKFNSRNKVDNFVICNTVVSSIFFNYRYWISRSLKYFVMAIACMSKIRGFLIIFRLVFVCKNVPVKIMFFLFARHDLNRKKYNIVSASLNWIVRF